MSLPVVAGQAYAIAPPGDDKATVLYFSRKGTTLSPLQPSLELPSIPRHILDSMGPSEP